MNLKINNSQFIADFEHALKNALNFGKLLKNRINALRLYTSND